MIGIMVIWMWDGQGKREARLVENCIAADARSKLPTYLNVIIHSSQVIACRGL